MSEKTIITVDGKPLQVEKKGMLLQALRDSGRQIPTLCEHPSLTPNGSCRLCTIEITRPEWQGWSKLVTSCLYPVEPGLEVMTRSPRVLQLRRTLLEMYLAESPASQELRDIARNEGVEETPFKITDKENKCVLCGLCVRICQDLGPQAIAPLNRGTEKKVGPRPDDLAEDCTGCRACAHVCPTKAIDFCYEDQKLKIWNREFAVPVCSVNPEICRACGICEEVCPFSIPRVTLYKSGISSSRIDAETCVGCGVCAGACPTGAISQKKESFFRNYDQYLEKTDLTGKTLIFACSRSKIPEGEQAVIQVPCVGSVSIETMLACLLKGASGVGLMCRDTETCPYARGGRLAEKRTAALSELCALAGLPETMARLLKPPAGSAGPLETARQFSATQSPSPLREIYPGEKTRVGGMDFVLRAMAWLKNRAELSGQLPARIRESFAPLNRENADLLYLGDLPELDLLLSLTMDDWRLTEVLAEVVDFLGEQGLAVKPVWRPDEIQKSAASRVITLEKHSPWPFQDKEQVTLEELSAATVGKSKESPEFTFRLTPAQRRQLTEYLKQPTSETGCGSARQLAQSRLLLRRGSWKQVFVPQAEYLCRRPPLDETTEESACPEFRIRRHPIMPPLNTDTVDFTFNGQALRARDGEVISSALYAAGISVLGHHHKDHGAQGIYCVNGQCSQCMVIADGRPVKSCMTPVTAGLKVESCEGLAALNDQVESGRISPDIEETAVEVLVVGGGPAGICAAIELGAVGIEVLIIDDKHELGGKLSLQTHNFFGSVKDCYAGDRGVAIGHTLADLVQCLPSVKIWLDSTVVGVFRDGKFGVAGKGRYRLVTPKRVLVAAGAREKSLAFPGCDLPGVYGAGAFQTLVNRDLVKCAERLFIIGGGNVGLIGAYHALQAGIDVIGLVEALPVCGGYKVHEDKIKRLGVPVWTSHTVLRIEGREKVERVITARIDSDFKPVPGTEREFEVDTVLIAVGLSPVDELLGKARQYGITVYAAGDAEEIAEASAAIFSGKIIGRRIAQDIGIDLPIPANWEEFGEMLKHRPGEALELQEKDLQAATYPIIRCVQEIPCNPCTEVCPKNLISMEGSILDLPRFSGACLGCGECVLACPGLAINLVMNDYDPEKKKALLMLPFEFNEDVIPADRELVTTDMNGDPVGLGRVIALKERESQNQRKLLLLEVPEEDKLRVAGFRIRNIDEGKPLAAAEESEEDPIVCRCERVRRSEILAQIRAGVRDMNQLKAVVRAGLGGCNGKTCTDLILRLYRQEGVPLEEITLPSNRPLVAEVHLGDFINEAQKENK